MNTDNEPNGTLTIRVSAMPKDANSAYDIFGRTSITLRVEAWAKRYLSDRRDLVTHAEFVMVSLDENGKPTPVPPEE